MPLFDLSLSAHHLLHGLLDVLLVHPDLFKAEHQLALAAPHAKVDIVDGAQSLRLTLL